LTIQDIQSFPFIMYDSQFYHNVIKVFEKQVTDMNVIFKKTNTEVIKRSVAE